MVGIKELCQHNRELHGHIIRLMIKYYITMSNVYLG